MAWFRDTLPWADGEKYIKQLETERDRVAWRHWTQSQSLRLSLSTHYGARLPSDRAPAATRCPPRRQPRGGAGRSPGAAAEACGAASRPAAPAAAAAACVVAAAEAASACSPSFTVCLFVAVRARPGPRAPASVRLALSLERESSLWRCWRCVLTALSSLTLISVSESDSVLQAGGGGIR